MRRYFASAVSTSSVYSRNSDKREIATREKAISDYPLVDAISKQLDSYFRHVYICHRWQRREQHRNANPSICSNADNSTSTKTSLLDYMPTTSRQKAHRPATVSRRVGDRLRKARWTFTSFHCSLWNFGLAARDTGTASRYFDLDSNPRPPGRTGQVFAEPRSRIPRPLH